VVDIYSHVKLLKHVLSFFETRPKSTTRSRSTYSCLSYARMHIFLERYRFLRNERRSSQKVKCEENSSQTIHVNRLFAEVHKEVAGKLVKDRFYAREKLSLQEGTSATTCCSTNVCFLGVCAYTQRVVLNVDYRQKERKEREREIKRGVFLDFN